MGIGILGRAVWEVDTDGSTTTNTEIDNNNKCVLGSGQRL